MTGYTSLQEAFSTAVLMGAYSAFEADGDGDFPTVQLFKSGDVRGFDGTVAKYDRQDFTRRIAPYGGGEGPSIADSGESRSHVRLDMIVNRFHRRLKLRDLMHNRGLGQLGPDAPGEVARCIRDMTRQANRLREYASAEVLGTPGGLTINASNVPLSRPGLAFSLDYTTTDFAATASWLTAGTKILSGSAELRTLKNSMLAQTGQDVGVMLIPKELTDGLYGNTEIQGWFQTTPQGVLLAQDWNAASLNGLGGIRSWRELNHGYDKSGTYTYFYPAGRAVALPGNLQGVLGWAEGSDVQLDGVSGLVGSPGSIVAQARLQRGTFFYAVIEADPAVVKIVCVDVFLPVIFHPAAVHTVDYVP